MSVLTGRKKAATTMLAARCRPFPCRLFPAALVFRRRIHTHPIPLLALVLELDLSVHDGEQRVVRAAPHIGPGMDLRAALAYEDRSRGHELPREPLHAEVLRTRV